MIVSIRTLPHVSRSTGATFYRGQWSAPEGWRDIPLLHATSGAAQRAALAYVGKYINLGVTPEN